MPLPMILGVAAAVAGIAGVGSGIHGGVKMKEAKNTMDAAQFFHERNMKHFEEESNETNEIMDQLGKLELDILKSFDDFSNIIEKIHNRPQFKKYNKNGVDIPEYDGEKLRDVSVGAGVLLGGLGGAAVGTAGGFAAAGATTTAVMALGTASTGTAISTLSGAAATNATLAALGGGATYAGGGGMLLGTQILGAATLGVGLLVGGIIFNVTGSSLSNKADEAFEQAMKAKREIDKICTYLGELKDISMKYQSSLSRVNQIYLVNLRKLQTIVISNKKNDWNTFTMQEKLLTENTVLLVGLLYNMCKVQLVLKSENDDMNTINEVEVKKSIDKAEGFLAERNLKSA